MEETYPTFDQIIYGDGSIAEIRSRREKIDEETGVNGYEFILNPSREIVSYYNLRKGIELDQYYGYVRKWYPKTDVIRPESKYPTARWLIVTDFEGSPTVWAKHFVQLKEMVEDLQKELKILRAQKARLFDMVSKITSQETRMMREFITMINEARKAGGTIKYDETERQDGDSDE